MKKIFLVLTAFLVMTGICMADSHVDTFTLSADGTKVINLRCREKHFFSIEVLTSADDAVTVSLANQNGSALYAATATTAATGGEILVPTTFYFVGPNDTLTLTLADMASGTAAFAVTFVK
jgi:hypothetical protein